MALLSAIGNESTSTASTLSRSDITFIILIVLLIVGIIGLVWILVYVLNLLEEKKKYYQKLNAETNEKQKGDVK